jgi:hypothetical protein
MDDDIKPSVEKASAVKARRKLVPPPPTAPPRWVRLVGLIIVPSVIAGLCGTILAFWPIFDYVQDNDDEPAVEHAILEHMARTFYFRFWLGALIGGVLALWFWRHLTRPGDLSK